MEPASTRIVYLRLRRSSVSDFWLRVPDIEPGVWSAAEISHLWKILVHWRGSRKCGAPPRASATLGSLAGRARHPLNYTQK